MGFDSAFKKIWEKGKKIDPLTHKALEAVVGNDSKNVRELSRGLAKVTGGDGTWLGSRFNDLGDEADKNHDDPVRGIGRAAASVGIAYGGYTLAGGGAGAGAGAGAAEGAGAVGGGAAAAGGEAAAGSVFNAAVDSQLANVGGSAVWGSAGNGVTGATVASNAPAAVDLGSAGGVQSTGGGGFSSQYQRLMQMRGQQQQRPPPLQLEEVEVEENRFLDDLALSSKKAKRPARSADDAIQRGARRENPIDTIGVQTAAIKALMFRLRRIDARREQLRSK